MRDYKLVVLGAGGVGKSCLTVQFVQGVYLDTYDPTIEDSYRKTIEIDNKVFDLEILDTAGVAQFTAMRELYIKSGMGFLLVYSVTDKQSLEELMELREQVLRIKDSNKVPMVLVGNKADLSDERDISVEEGIEVSTKWGKVPFYETSALLRSNVDEVYVDLVRQIIRNEMETVAKSDARKSSIAKVKSNAPGNIKQRQSSSSINQNTSKNNSNNTQQTEQKNRTSSKKQSLVREKAASPNNSEKRTRKTTTVNKTTERQATVSNDSTIKEEKKKKNKNKKNKHSCVIL